MTKFISTNLFHSNASMYFRIINQLSFSKYFPSLLIEVEINMFKTNWINPTMCAEGSLKTLYPALKQTKSILDRNYLSLEKAVESFHSTFSLDLDLWR